MKILLVQIPTSHLGAKERVYPLGLSRLSGLVPQEYMKKTLDMNLSFDPWMDLYENLKAERPDIIALSFRNMDPLAGHHTSYLSSLKTAAELSKKILPKAKVIVGGPAFSLFAERLLAEIPEIDAGIKGEAELSFVKLICGADPSTLPGMVFRKDDNIISVPPTKKISMDEIPSIDSVSFNPSDYTKDNLYVAAMGIETKRGCDLHCGYCIYPCLGGGKVRLRSPQKVVDEIEFFQKNYGINLFHFTDSVVNRPTKQFEAVCHEIIRRKIKIMWTGFFREDTLTLKNATLAQKAGLTACYFSADALTTHGLELLNKKLTKDIILKASKITAEINLLTMCHFLVNLPFETPEHHSEAEKMLDQLLEIHASTGNLGAVIFNTIRLYPGAPLTSKLIKVGLLDQDTDLLFPVYYNPVESSHIQHRFEAKCHAAGIFSRINHNETG